MYTHAATSPSTNYHSCDLTRPGQWFSQNGQKETCPGISAPNYSALSSLDRQCCRWEVGRGLVTAWQRHNGALWHCLEQRQARALERDLFREKKGFSRWDIFILLLFHVGAILLFGDVSLKMSHACGAGAGTTRDKRFTWLKGLTVLCKEKQLS